MCLIDFNNFIFLENNTSLEEVDLDNQNPSEENEEKILEVICSIKTLKKKIYV